MAKWIMSAAAAFLACQINAQTPDFRVVGTAKVQTIPIALTGYSGEVASVLKFDLEIAGFDITDTERAQYLLSGKNNGAVEGRLQDKLSKASLLAKAYTGDNARAQAHALADDVITAILRIPGIARTKVAFKLQPQSSGNGEIYISDYDGQNAKPVTQDNSIVAAPVWVPKKWQLLYTSYKSGYPWIYSHNLTTGERRPFAKFPGLNSSAAVSPDGNRVAMILSKAGSPDVWVCNMDGSGLTQLTKTREEDESSPCWSPDGTKICFAGREGGRRALFTISSNGGQMTRLNTAGQPNPSEPDWSPDGKSIVFTSQYSSGFNICVMPARGGDVERLVDGEDPSWAPNSRTVIFTRRVGNKRVLSLLDVPTRRVKDTAQVSGSRSQPNWAK